MMKLWSLVLVALLTLAHTDADARRLGGGKSFGRQSGNVTQREAARTPPAQPHNAATNQATPNNATGAAAAPKKPFGGMGGILGGLAAGLGLAWLANALGMGEAFGQLLLMGLLAFAIMAVVGMVMRSRKTAAAGGSGAPFAFQGAGNAPAEQVTERVYTPPPAYSPENVGNDASARPWERSGNSGGGSMIGSALAGSQNWGIPAGFDTEGFLAAAKRNFTTLQAAWDKRDLDTLRSMMTDGMLEEIRAQLAEREQHRSAAGDTGNSTANQTDVVVLEAQLLGIEELDDDYMASVEFSGMIREEPSAGPSPFREVWNMTKPKTGNSGWLVAGVQAL